MRPRFPPDTVRMVPAWPPDLPEPLAADALMVWTFLRVMNLPSSSQGRRPLRPQL